MGRKVSEGVNYLVIDGLDRPFGFHPKEANDWAVRIRRSLLQVIRECANPNGQI